MTALRIPSQLTQLVLLAALLTAPAASALPNKQGATNSCDCYYFTDCPEPEIATCTGFGACGPDGKLDGTCLLIPTGDPAPQDLLAQAIGLYFDAYLVAISDGEGRPDERLLLRAEAVRLTEGQRKAARDAVHDTLDIVLGFDFQQPLPVGSSAGPGRGVGPARFGNVRGTPPESPAIAQAARTALVQAVRTGNLNAVAEPLQAFWAAHPNFRPHHTGRAYPHGHHDYDETIGSPLTGQIETIRRIARRLLPQDAAICGDGVRQGAETCDGADDAACPSLCSTICTCNFVP